MTVALKQLICQSLLFLSSPRLSDSLFLSVRLSISLLYKFVIYCNGINFLHPLKSRVKIIMTYNDLISICTHAILQKFSQNKPTFYFFFLDVGNYNNRSAVYLYDVFILFIFRLSCNAVQIDILLAKIVLLVNTIIKKFLLEVCITFVLPSCITVCMNVCICIYLCLRIYLSFLSVICQPIRSLYLCIIIIYN